MSSRDAFAVLTVTLSTVACATIQPSAFPNRPMVASVGPVIGALPDDDAEVDEESSSAEVSAGLLLERGIGYLHHDQFRPAAVAFDAALDSGQLNDAGRALAYWHIFMAQRGIGNVDACADALASFVSVAEILINERAEDSFMVDDDSDFVAHFDLERRVARARATLSAVWAVRSDGFGRRVETAVPVRTDDELNFFLDAASSCSDQDRSVSRRRVAEDSDASIEQVTLSCKGGAEQFYFAMPQ